MSRPSAEDWSCPSCASEVPAGFSVCWSCGTSRDGRPDPTFRPVEEAHAEEVELRPGHQAVGVQFGLRSALVVIAISAAAMAAGSQMHSAPTLARLLALYTSLIVLGSLMLALYNVAEKVIGPAGRVITMAVALFVAVNFLSSLFVGH